MAEFPTTRWSKIVAGRIGPEARRKLLEDLSAAYWQPLYVFARRKGLSADAAQDAVQELFANLLEREFVDALSPEKGKLRSFLRTSLSNHMADEAARKNTKKRGGDIAFVSLETHWADRAVADTSSLSPEQAYDRAWAQVVFERAFGKLKSEFDSGARTGPFGAIVDSFRSPSTDDQRSVAKRYGLSISQLKSLLFRARNRLRALVDEEIGDTISDASELGGERREIGATLTIRRFAATDSQGG